MIAHFRSHARPLLGAACLAASALCVAGCGSSHSAPSPASTQASTTARSTSGGASAPGASSGGDAPIGNGDINMGSGSASASYPPSELSQDLATDCYSGGDRIYDRYGVTCTDAKRVLVAYEGSAQSRSGAQKSIEKYQCSHNPNIMVNQGAAPGKCVDGSGNVVFNWRYPGAPQPDRG